MLLKNKSGLKVSNKLIIFLTLNPIDEPDSIFKRSSQQGLSYFKASGNARPLA
tara:strand:- start:59 stop:217 length:159 start_codon:yes stop_codon:yes gene_type:complete